MKIGLIGQGAIARYVQNALTQSAYEVVAFLLRPERARADALLEFGSVDALPSDIDVMIDCAGHSALTAYGPALLARGTDVITVSLGALADPDVEAALKEAARQGHAKLHLASGAIGALDCLRAAAVGALESVTYTGRKPPQGWIGSPAETMLDLSALTQGAHTHFEGTARQAALAYPKNANVAAAVALAGTGFDNTHVQLIADTDVTENIHEVSAAGDFGTFQFRISGKALPDNPRSSALAAMSVVAKLEQLNAPVST